MAKLFPVMVRKVSIPQHVNDIIQIVDTFQICSIIESIIIVNLLNSFFVTYINTSRVTAVLSIINGQLLITK